jgi:hypothetical protein
MKPLSRVALAVTIVTAGTGMLLGSTFLFMKPSSVFADDSASSTPSSTATSTDMSTDSSDASSTQAAASSTPDTTNPTLTFAFSIPVTDPTGDNPIPVTATFSEPVTGFQVSSLNIAIGHATDFTQVSPTQYTFNVVLDAPQGTMSVDSNDPNVRDASGNIAIAAPQLHVAYSSSLTNYTGSSTSTTTTASSTGSTGGTGGTSGGSGSTTTPPWVEILSGPANGSTISTSTATFTFATDGMSIITCSFGGVTSMYPCGSPQTFNNLVDGVYPFSIYAQYGSQTASSSSTFTVDLEAATTTTATSTDTSGSTTSGGSDSSSTSGSTSGSSYSGGGSSGQYAGPEEFGTNAGTEGGSIAGGSGNTPVVTTTTGTTGGATTGVGGSTVSPTYPGTGYEGGSEATSATTTATDTASSLINLDATDTAATNTQEAAAGLSGVDQGLLWGGLLIIILLIIGGTYWYSQRAE